MFNNALFIKDTDIRRIFDQLKIEDAAQAFYMGKELQKALLAMQLGKKYVQEAELRWGYLSEGPAFPARYSDALKKSET